MSTHGLLTRDERDFYLRRLEPEAMRPIELAQLAERLGYHSLWLSDHVCMGRDLGARHTANESGTRAYPDQPVMLDVVATIGALAATTERVRLAPSVLIAPYRHPLTVAHQFATLDVLSGGRLIMAAGSGWDPQEFAALASRFRAPRRGNGGVHRDLEARLDRPVARLARPVLRDHRRVARAQAGAEAAPADRVRRGHRGRRAPRGADERRPLSDVPRRVRRPGPLRPAPRGRPPRGRAHRPRSLGLSPLRVRVRSRHRSDQRRPEDAR